MWRYAGARRIALAGFPKLEAGLRLQRNRLPLRLVYGSLSLALAPGEAELNLVVRLRVARVLIEVECRGDHVSRTRRLEVSLALSLSRSLQIHFYLARKKERAGGGIEFAVLTGDMILAVALLSVNFDGDVMQERFARILEIGNFAGLNF